MGGTAWCSPCESTTFTPTCLCMWSFGIDNARLHDSLWCIDCLMSVFSNAHLCPSLPAPSPSLPSGPASFTLTCLCSSTCAMHERCTSTTFTLLSRTHPPRLLRCPPSQASPHCVCAHEEQLIEWATMMRIELEYPTQHLKLHLNPSPSLPPPPPPLLPPLLLPVDPQPPPGRVCAHRVGDGCHGAVPPAPRARVLQLQRLRAALPRPHVRLLARPRHAAAAEVRSTTQQQQLLQR